MKPLSEAERLDMFAMQIVHLVGRIQHEKVPDDATSKAFVDIRQASNDEAIEAVKDLIRKDRKAYGEQVEAKTRLETIESVKSWADDVEITYNQMISDELDKVLKRNQGEKD